MAWQAVRVTALASAGVMSLFVLADDRVDDNDDGVVVVGSGEAWAAGGRRRRVVRRVRKRGVCIGGGVSVSVCGGDRGRICGIGGIGRKERARNEYAE